jgi:hypothetical protein
MLLPILGIYSLLSLIAVSPATKYWNTQMIGRAPDVEQNVWNFWWIERSVRQGYLFPFHTDLLYYPRGVSLAYHTLDLYNGYGSLFLRNLLRISFPSSYNTLVVIACLIGTMSAYLLVKSITGSEIAGFIAGIIYVYSPFTMSRLHFGQLGLFTSMQYIPLVLFFVLKGVRTSNWRYPLIAGIFTAIIGWQSINMGGETILFALFLLLIFGYRGLTKVELGKHLAILILVTGLLILPSAYPMIRDYSDFKDQMNWSVSASSNDLLTFILPDSSISALWRSIFSKISNQPLTDYYQINGQRTSYIGLGVIILSALSIIVIPVKNLWRWWLVAGLSLLLCTGPVIYFKGQVLMPNLLYTLMSKIPFMSLAREPSRWGVFLIIALSVIIGYFCSAVASQSYYSKGILLVCGLLIYIEFLATPVILNDGLNTISPFYQKLAQTQLSGGIMEVPFDLVGAQGPASEYMLYQTVHGKPIASGYISRTPNRVANMFQKYPFINQLRARVYNDHEPVIFSDKIITKGLKELRFINIEYVILHKNFVSESDARLYEITLTKVISVPIYEDVQIIVWHVTQ